MPKKILVGERDVVVQNLVDFTLRREGFEVICVSNGGSLRQAVKEVNPVLLLLDSQLEGSDLPLLVKEVNQEGQSIPILLLGKPADLPNETALRQVGVTDFIKKPILSSELIERVKKCIGEKETPPLSESPPSSGQQVSLREAVSELVAALEGVAQQGVRELAVRQTGEAISHIARDAMEPIIRETVTSLAQEARQQMGGTILEAAQDLVRRIVSETVPQLVETAMREEIQRLGGEKFEEIIRKIAEARIDTVVRELVPRLVESAISREIERLESLEG